MICSKCDGSCFISSGTCSYSEIDGNIIENVNICPKCQGTGKVDWIENIVGKDKPVLNVKIGQPEFLYDVNIRPIKFPKGGVKIWGQKTLKK